MSAVLNPRDALSNRLLEKMPEEEYQRLLPRLLNQTDGFSKTRFEIHKNRTRLNNTYN